MKKSLDQRFKDFLNTLSEIENIDQLNLTHQQKRAKKADYFGQNRKLIIELKSLETDTQPKVEKILEPHQSRPEFPDFFGGWEVNKILKHLPDGNDINKEIVEAVTSSLQTIYRKANRQIRVTKATFQLPDAQGLLIILNENIDVLTPDHIIYRLRRTANKKHPDKSYQFVEIDYVLVISEAHFSIAPNNEMGYLILHIPMNIFSVFKYEKFVKYLAEKWTEYNNIPHYDLGELRTPDDLKTISVSQFEREQKKLVPRHEAWRRYYKRNPYFHSFNEDKLKWMFKIIMEGCANGILKGATQKQKNDAHFWMETFTHFLEELRNRGLDMKIFAPEMKKLGKEIESEMKDRFPDMDDNFSA
ncbi:MAG: hypothetical protein KIS76_19375 [Pyrinomonadaceae bacterium]|nr:hypothetical protein [Pyrinomonadaceae bacterium]